MALTASNCWLLSCAEHTNTSVLDVFWCLVPFHMCTALISWLFQAWKTLWNGRVFRVWNFFLFLHHLPHLTWKTRPNWLCFSCLGYLYHPEHGKLEIIVASQEHVGQKYCSLTNKKNIHCKICIYLFILWFPCSTNISGPLKVTKSECYCLQVHMSWFITSTSHLK